MITTEILNLPDITSNSFQGGCTNCGFGRIAPPQCPFCLIYNISEAARKYLEAKKAGATSGLYYWTLPFDKTPASPSYSISWGRQQKIHNPLYTGGRGKINASTPLEASKAAANAGSGFGTITRFRSANKADRAVGNALNAAYNGNNIKAYQSHEESAIHHLQAANDLENRGRGRNRRWAARAHRRAALANIIAAGIHKKAINLKDLPQEQRQRLGQWSAAIPAMQRWIARKKRNGKSYEVKEHFDTLGTMLYHSKDNPALLDKIGPGLGDEQLKEEAKKQKKALLPLIIPVKDEQGFQQRAATATGGRLGAINIEKEKRAYPPEAGQLVLFKGNGGRNIHIGRVEKTESNDPHWNVHLDSKGRSELTNEEIEQYKNGLGKKQFHPDPTNDIEHQLYRAGRYDKENNHAPGHSIGMIGEI